MGGGGGKGVGEKMLYQHDIRQGVYNFFTLCGMYQNAIEFQSRTAFVRRYTNTVSQNLRLKLVAKYNV